MIEESVESEGDETVVTLSLFHDANGDEENYNRRAYISVPLTKYVDEENPHQTIRIKSVSYTHLDVYKRQVLIREIRA